MNLLYLLHRELQCSVVVRCLELNQVQCRVFIVKGFEMTDYPQRHPITLKRFGAHVSMRFDTSYIC